MQSKKMSLIETLASTLIGYLVATAANYLILPIWFPGVTWTNASIVGIIFTGISLVRGYVVRRLFNWIEYRRLVKEWGPYRPSNVSMKDWLQDIKRG